MKLWEKIFDMIGGLVMIGSAYSIAFPNAGLFSMLSFTMFTGAAILWIGDLMLGIVKEMVKNEY